MSQQTDFLNKIKGGAYHVWKVYKILPSVAAAQAALESSWGKSDLSIKANNLFGVKAVSGQASVSMPTQEADRNGNFYWINGSFAKYDSWNHSILSYGKLLGTASHYAAVPGLRDPRAQITAIIRGGYASDPTYVQKIVSIISSNGLRAWDLDAFKGGDGGGFEGNVADEYKNFNVDLIKKNAYTRPQIKLSSIQGVVIHDIVTTSGISSVRNNLENGNGGQKMGYHILVSEQSATMIVPPNEGVYHAERGENKVSGLKNRNSSLISIGVLTKNAKNAYSTNLNVKLALVLGELFREYKLSSTALLPAWEVDGVKEPLNWYNNPFYFTGFRAMLGDAIDKGEEVVTNPDYKQPGLGNIGSDGIILNGRGAIVNIIEEARYLLGSMTYAMVRPVNIRRGGIGDCSSFVQYLYKKHANIDIGSYTDAQWFGSWGKKIPVKDCRAGDIIFFHSTYPTYMTTTHVGVVIEPGKMIDFGNTPGPKLNNYNDGIWGPKIYGAKRIFSDKDYEQAVGKKEPSKPTIDPKGTYAVSVKSYTPAKSSDIGGLTTRRLNPNEVYRVEEVGTASLKISDNLWVPKDSPTIALSRLQSKSTPVGMISTKLPTRVYSEPSVASKPYNENGKEIVIPAMSYEPIYAVQAGFVQVDPKGEKWAVANSSYASIEIDLKEETVGNIDLGVGIPTELTIKAHYDESQVVFHDSDFRQGPLKTIIAHQDLLALGTVVEIYVPSNELSIEAVVASNDIDSLDGDVISLTVPNEGYKYNFGTRKCVLTPIGEIKDRRLIEDYISGQYEFKKEE